MHITYRKSIKSHKFQNDNFLLLLSSCEEHMCPQIVVINKHIYDRGSDINTSSCNTVCSVYACCHLSLETETTVITLKDHHWLWLIKSKQINSSGTEKAHVSESQIFKDQSFSNRRTLFYNPLNALLNEH